MVILRAPIEHIYREVNQCVDAMAKFGSSLDSLLYFQITHYLWWRIFLRLTRQLTFLIDLFMLGSKSLEQLANNEHKLVQIQIPKSIGMIRQCSRCLWGMRNRRGRTIEQNRPKGQYIPTICQDRFGSIKIRLSEKPRRAVPPKSPRDKYSSRDQRLTVKSTMLGAEEGKRDMQVKKGDVFR